MGPRSCPSIPHISVGLVVTYWDIFESATFLLRIQKNVVSKRTYEPDISMSSPIKHAHIMLFGRHVEIFHSEKTGSDIATSGYSKISGLDRSHDSVFEAY